MDLVTICSDALRVQISPLGAEMVRVTDAGGNERLWEGDPAVWAGHAPVLFPMAGSLVGGGYRFEGRRYPLGKHGFARGSRFRVETAEAGAASFLLTPEEASPEGFPFDYRFRVRFAVRGNAVDITYETENRASATFWYGCGAHEAYPCPEGIGAYWIDFPDDEGEVLHSVLEGPFLAGGTQAVRLDGHRLHLSPALFANDSLVLASLKSREVVLGGGADGRTVRVDFRDFPYLLIWSMLPAGRFVCIEPWHNLPDAVGGNGDIAARPGMIALAPGETRALSHSVTFAQI